MKGIRMTELEPLAKLAGTCGTVRIHLDGIPVRLKPASDEADEMHERMRETPVEEAEVEEESVQEVEVEEESVQEAEVEGAK